MRPVVKHFASPRLNLLYLVFYFEDTLIWGWKNGHLFAIFVKVFETFPLVVIFQQGVNNVKFFNFFLKGVLAIEIAKLGVHEIVDKITLSVFTILITQEIFAVSCPPVGSF